MATVMADNKSKYYLRQRRSKPQIYIVDHLFACAGLSWEEVKEYCKDGVVRACHNSEKTVTISGPRQAVEQAVEQLKQKGIFAKEVNSAGVAFHSPMLQSCAKPFLTALKKVYLTSIS